MNKKTLQRSLILATLTILSIVIIQNELTLNQSHELTEASFTKHVANSENIKNTLAAYGKTPMGFEKNTGQTDAQVAFLARGQGYTIFLTPSEAVLKMQPTETSSSSSSKIPMQLSDPLVLRMQLLESNKHVLVEGLDTMSSKSNYFIGSESQTNIAQYKQVKYNNIYSGIDLIYYGNQQRLEYDFIVHPGADPEAIQISFTGADTIEIGQDGQLNIHSSDETLQLLKPIIYQEIDGQKKFIEGQYTLADNQVGFELAAYDTNSPLVIDPILVYSTYLDGNLHGGLTGIAIDAAGYAYIVGKTVSTNFPTTNGAYQTTRGGVWYATVSKLDPTGTSLIYSTYLGGNNATMGEDIAIDNAGNAYVVGGTAASNFPTTAGSIQAVNNSGWGKYNGFITKLNTTGSALLYSTHLGGSTGGTLSDIALDAAGNAYVSGRTQSVDFPVTMSVMQTSYGGGIYDVVVAKINPTATQLIYATYIGSSGYEDPRGIAIDSNGNAIVTGFTDSPLYPTTIGAYQQAYGGGRYDAFVSKLNADGTSLIYSTFLGGTTSDRSFDIALDNAGNAYLSGDTNSNDFPITANVYQSSFTIWAGYTFVTKLNPSGSDVIYSTYVGMGRGYAIAIDATGRAYVAGLSRSSPTTTNAMQRVSKGMLDAFVIRLSPSGSTLEYGTFIGGSAYDTATDIAVDPAGNVYMTGVTASTDFPLLNPIQAVYGGDVRDGFVAKMTTIDNQPPIANAGVDQIIESTGSTTSVPLNASASTDPDGDTLSYAWSGSFGTATGAMPLLNLSNGIYTITLTVDDGNGATASDIMLVTVQDTTPPIVNAGLDVILEATSAAGATYNVAAQVLTSDVCAVFTSIAPVGIYPLGSTIVTVTATDCANNTASDQVIVTVQDTIAPVLTLNPTGGVTALDSVDGIVIPMSDQPTPTLPGTYTITWTATDSAGNISRFVETVIIPDTAENDAKDDDSEANDSKDDDSEGDDSEGDESKDDDSDKDDD